MASSRLTLVVHADTGLAALTDLIRRHPDAARVALTHIGFGEALPMTISQAGATIAVRLKPSKALCDLLLAYGVTSEEVSALRDAFDHDPNPRPQDTS